MITEERIRDFIRSLEPPEDEQLYEIRKEALKDGVPILRPETEALLLFFVDLLKPEKILEIGCAVGYSAIAMGKRMPENGRILTMEKWAPRIPKARENFEKTGMTEKITLLAGDATDILPGLTDTYDLIFMDAAKAQYILWLPEVLRLLAPGGVLISDNVLQDGDVLESRFTVKRRDRTIHKRMREYLLTLKQREDLSTAVIPIGDGVAVTTKKEGKHES